MDIDDAAKTTDAFLDKYVADNDYFTPKADLANADAKDRELHVLSFFGTRPKNGVILVQFFYGQWVDRKKHDPESRAAGAMAALKKAHPEVAAFEFQVKVTKQY